MAKSGPAPEAFSRLLDACIQAAVAVDSERRIVFLAGRRIYICDFDGGNKRRLVTVKSKLSSLREGDTALAPDGKSLAFVSDDDVHVVALAGGVPVRLTKGRKAWQLAWWSRPRGK